MPNAAAKKTASALKTATPLPGTEPGLGQLPWRKLLRFLQIILMVAIAFSIFKAFLPLQSTPVTIGSSTFNTEVVKTPQERQQGLSGRQALPANHGMLFVFDTTERWSIWMKDMHFAIDILWLNDQKQVVDIKHSVSPETYPQAFRPLLPARYVLELPAGTAEAANIHIGDSAAFNL